MAWQRLAERMAGFVGAALGVLAGFFWYGYAYWRDARRRDGGTRRRSYNANRYVREGAARCLLCRGDFKDLITLIGQEAAGHFRLSIRTMT